MKLKKLLYKVILILKKKLLKNDNYFKHNNRLFGSKNLTSNGFYGFIVFSTKNKK